MLQERIEPAWLDAFETVLGQCGVIRPEEAEALIGGGGAMIDTAPTYGRAEKRLGEVLRLRFLAGVPRGGWYDELDAEGRCLSRFMPASTLYHLMGAIEELSRFAARRTAAAAD